MSSNDLLDQMAGDSARLAEAANSQSDKLDRLTALAAALKETEAEIEEREKALSDAKARARELSEKQIPSLFEELGVDEMKLRDGSKVTVKRTYAASITEANAPKAFEWLRQKGHDSIIKHTVAVEIKRGETEEHRRLLESLDGLGVSYADKEAVHPSTLKSFVTEQMTTEGSDLPQELFGVYPINITKVSKPK